MKRLLVVLSALLLASPARAKLEIAQVEATHGALGPKRPSLDFYPLDEVFFRYQVNGAQTDADGKTDVEVVHRLTNTLGKVVYEHKSNHRRQLSLNENTFPGYAVLSAPEKAPPGEYVFSVRVHDRLAKETAGFERKLTCKPVSFQVLMVRFWRDAEGKVPAPAGGLVGETIHFKLRVIGFDKSKKKVHTTLTVILVDENGKPIAPQPPVVKAALDDPAEAAKATQVNFSGLIYLNRTGNFTLRLKVDDIQGKQTATFETPLKVVAP